MTFGGLGVYFWVFWVIFCLLVCFCLVPSPEAPAASERKVVEPLVFTEAPLESQYIDWNALVNIMWPGVCLSEAINHPLGLQSHFPAL